MERSAYEDMRRVERDHWWFAGRRAILTSEISRLPIPAGSRVLEVGCGPGGNLAMLAQFGPLTAIEPDDSSRAHALAQFGAQSGAQSGPTILPGTLPDGLPDLGTFGLVAALDVVEHVDDDLGALKALRGLCAPDGFVVVTVPAGPWMWSAHDARHHHKRRYTADSLRERLEEAGLAVHRLTHFNSLLFPPIAAVRLLQRLSRGPGSEDERMPGRVVNTALRQVFQAERGLLRITDLPFGVSLLAICRSSD